MNSRPSIKYNVESPSEDEFTPLQEHQEQTPSTFFGAKPVLYFQTSGLELVGPKEKLQSGPAFAQFSTEGEDTNEGDVLARNIDVWVTSEFAGPLFDSCLHTNKNFIGSSSLPSKPPRRSACACHIHSLRSTLLESETGSTRSS